MRPRLRDRLATPAHGGSLAAFRIAFGLVMALQGLALLAPAPGGSWIRRRLEGPEVGWTVPFPGLEWLRPPPQPGTSLLAAAVVGTGLLLAAGLLPRLAAALLLAAWSWIWLADQTQFNNHWYLMSLLALLLVFLPSARRYSLGAWRRRRRGLAVEHEVPEGAILVLRAQLLVVYFFGGVTKLTSDYLLRAEPVRSFLADARLLAWTREALGSGAAARLGEVLAAPAAAHAFAWAGLVFDLAVGPLLLVRRTRFLALLLAALFHLLNHAVLFDDIGYFPLLGFAATLVFLDPDWPERLGRWLRRPRLARPDWGFLVAGALLVPVAGALLGWRPRPSPPPQPPRCFALRRRTAVAAAAFLALQALLPLRHLPYPGDVSWTGEGLFFGWRMKTALKTRDLYAVIVEEPSAAAPAPAPAAARPVVYRHVPASAVPWPGLPELVVVLEPPYGERLLYNPRAGGRERAPGEARRRVEELGLAALGAAPAASETLPLYLALRAREAQERARGGGLAALLREARVYAMAVALLAPGEDDLYLQARRLRERLERLLAIPEEAGWLRAALARAHPLAASGAPDPGVPFLVVGEEAPGLPARVDAERWSAATGGPLVVLADFRRLAPEDWRRLPRALPLALPGDAGRGRLWWWNAARDLPDPVRRDWVLAQPGALQLYARRVAREWERGHAVRPRVRAWSWVWVNRVGPRPIVDPEADLAAAPVTWIRHDPWRLPAPAPPDPALPLTY